MESESTSNTPLSSIVTAENIFGQIALIEHSNIFHLVVDNIFSTAKVGIKIAAFQQKFFYSTPTPKFSTEKTCLYSLSCSAY